MHVEDLAAAYLLVLEQLFQGQTDLGRIDIHRIQIMEAAMWTKAR
ncbi:hypothetical protein [Brevundimonas sp.]